jgi:hypothetical protein
MSGSHHPFLPGPQWHVDCRIVAELPEDSIVGRRFLVKLLFGSVTLILFLVAGWLLYSGLSQREHIGDWERRLTDNQAEVREIQRLQREYGLEAAKIEAAYTLVNSPLMVSDFIAQIGRTRLKEMTIDIIESSGGSLVLRGSLSETSSERASRALGKYVEDLRNNPQIGPRFLQIVLKSLERRENNDPLSFEISFAFAPATP